MQIRSGLPQGKGLPGIQEKFGDLIKKAKHLKILAKSLKNLT